MFDTSRHGALGKNASALPSEVAHSCHLTLLGKSKHARRHIRNSPTVNMCYNTTSTPAAILKKACGSNKLLLCNTGVVYACGDEVGRWAHDMSNRIRELAMRNSSKGHNKQR